MEASLVITPKTSLTGEICDGTISHINSHDKQYHRQKALKC